MPSFLATAIAIALSLPCAQGALLGGLLSGSAVCQNIATQITGKVYYPTDLSPNFVTGISHWMTSSSDVPTCLVEVASAQDVSAVLKIVGQSRTPFAVKSGGHASNPGFSATPGVHISLVRLKGTTLNADKTVATVGMGSIWTEVFNALEGSGVNVVGGRVAGPGVGGFTLGGGFSWKTQAYGLTCDTVISYNLVLPNGTITTVDASKPDLYFALKGGLNRFGIVTSIKLKTFAQSAQVYGGFSIFDATKLPALIAATDKFNTDNQDPKAAVILTVNGGAVPNAILLSFYDGPSKPAAFNVYDGITPILSTVRAQTFSSFAAGTPSQLQGGSRGAFATLSTTGLTKNFMMAVYNESQHYGTLSILRAGTLLSYDIEPFTDYGKHATDSAFPHANSPVPLNLYFAWLSASEDEYWRAIMRQSIATLKQVAINEGIYQANRLSYPNYALSTTAPEEMYGVQGLARLRAIKRQVDPQQVMDLAGGFPI
ncbi:hypothetical protein BCR37DRAFT_343476 [Protomyces lactucae-debilis]|uniref:FAD-binding PCMH-type domain-containing protein n=1 Tax=Protomyces lactucae-debilis TaxID=2754530 RepID=A0A1Y2FUX2_PROLT|nr:uncharacterized protein BCR37DRAFT_343476 [Protomyces lactucae-debilis]ORY86976.1 hypothetical protein BCR37DRAFT_343476 [Protomyces lactucae-debilis]